MRDGPPRLGLVLHNRGVVTGTTTVSELLRLAEGADQAGWDSVWVGDSLLAKPRVDAIALLSAVAARTRRVRLGPACMVTTPLRQPLVLAQQWASLDVISGGRTVFAACPGQPGASGGDFEREYRALGVEPGSRLRRLEETVEILRLLSSQARTSYQGQHYAFEEVSLLPRPVQQPLPIWIVASPSLAKSRNVASAFGRVARLGDGWMTTLTSPDDIRRSLELIRVQAEQLGRTLPDRFEACLYFSINVDDDRNRAFGEAKRFLDAYYSADFSAEYVAGRVALGPTEDCVRRLRQYFEAGVDTIVLRLASFGQQRQFERVTEQVLPRLG